MTPEPPTPHLHPLLQRQMRRLSLDPAAAPAGWGELLQRVTRAYREHDEANQLMAHSQQLASDEMLLLTASLQAERDSLEARVAERTGALRVSEARLTSLLSLSADWIWEQDAELRFTYFSQGLREATGIDPDTLIGQERLAASNWAAQPEALAAYEAALAARLPFRDFTYDLTRADGRRISIRISGLPITDEQGCFQGYRGIGRDVSALTEADRRVAQLASTDTLTGLPNRNQFGAELELAIGRARRQGLSFAVCFIDLDRFKTVNDTLGHAAGDDLLCTMAGRLHGVLRQNDVVARLGGDEFVVLLEGAATPEDAAVVAEKLRLATCEPMMLRGCRFELGASLGVALYPRDGDEATTLLQHADAAMYDAKNAGGNAVRFYTPDMADSARQAFELESALRLALTRDELVLHYQPKLHAGSGELSGLEALVRWQHPTRGLVMPGEFIPLAEERGLILTLGRWVLRAACRQIAAWAERGLAPVPVAVNVSARQFNSGCLLHDVSVALAESGVAPSLLVLELTESTLMADPQRAADLLRRLHDQGVRIAIDDFGTGYSSLAHLKRFPAGQLKLDRSFVRGLPDDEGDRAITGAVIAMAHNLGLDVVAEGVETEDQRRFLVGLGCDELQGYLLGRPAPPEQAHHWLRAAAPQPRASCERMASMTAL